jgi:hypothetical protein
MNRPPKGIQDLIYSLEEGGGKVWMARTLFVLIAVFLGACYHLRDFRNLSTPEAMDTAQLARNLSENKGYTTQFIRPASLFLLQKQAAKHGQSEQGLLRNPHPDLANPPVYPFILAGWMKALPFKHKIMEQGGEGGFERHQPDVLISYLNLGFFALLLFQVFLFAKKLFDVRVASLSVAILFGCDILWRFTYSGLSTVLLLNLFLLLIRGLMSLEAGDRLDQPRGLFKSMFLALLLGALVGIGCMTRYSFGWFILPVSVFVLIWGGTRRWLLAPATLLAFAIVIAPWLYRNYSISGQPFGVATYTIAEETSAYTGTRLLRSLHPDLSGLTFDEIRRKFVIQTSDLLQNDLSRLGGSWVSGFFFVGLLVPFNNRALQRMRWFLIAAIATAVAIQALGRTWLSTLSPTINSENQLVLLLPLLVIYSVSLFHMLLDRLEFPVPQIRSILVGVFTVVASLPFIFTILQRTPAIVYPPYRPDLIQLFSFYLKPNEMLMTDMPWATAWYGNRDSIWITARVQDPKGDDFFSINDLQRPIAAIYITPVSADAPLRPAFLRDPDFAWGRFYMDALLLGRMPDGFPLKNQYGGGMIEAGHFFLTDWKRW